MAVGGGKPGQTALDGIENSGQVLDADLAC